MMMLYEACPDIVVMSDRLPKIDGKYLHQRLHEICDIPCIVLGNKKVQERAMVIEEGADLYLDSSISHRMLVAYILCLLKRYDRTRSNLKLDPQTHEIHLGNCAVTLTRTEFRLMSCLAMNR